MAATNEQIAELFENMGSLLEMKGDSIFKIRAYQRAARTIENLASPLAQAVETGEDLTKIPGVGKAISEKIAEFVKTGQVAAYQKLLEELPPGVLELKEIPGIGPKIAASIAAYFQVEANKTVIEKLRAAGVNLKQEPRQVDTEGLPLAGKTFVVTGTLSGFSRSESESRIKDLGGKVTSSVTKNTDYVVVGESPGSKLAAAERLGTEILDESAFADLLANPPVEAGS